MQAGAHRRILGRGTYIMSDKAHPVDVRIGKAVRLRRKALGVSQTELAQALGLSFQQLQKYENGVNRISASKLFEISQHLRMRAGDFFDETSGETTLNGFLRTPQGVQLIDIFTRIENPEVRRKLLELMRSLAGERPTSASAPTE